jgi:hypothetical protein
MRIANRLVLAVASLLGIVFVGHAGAQSISSGVRHIALKSGESTEVNDVYFISHNCKSLLKGAPDVEILDGPPGVTAAISVEKVVPRTFGCAKPVSGGKLIVTAKDIQEYSHTRMVLRVNLKTLNGDRQYSENIDITLYPPN